MARILWLNGTFGVGKTTTGRLLADRARLRFADPESVGSLLREHISDHEVSDFQEWPSWRRLVPPLLDELAAFTRQDAVAVQTVLVEDYWRELRAGLESLGHDVFHVVLDADEGVILARIDGDRVESQAARWRRQHLSRYVEARGWLTSAADLRVDTSNLDPDEVAARVLAAYDGASRRASFTR